MIVAYINSLILLLISAIHIYWGFGGKWGLIVALPERNNTKVFRPSPVATLIVAAILGCMALFYLYKVNQLAIFNSVNLPWLDQYGLWLLAGIFLLRAIGDFRYVGFFKQVYGSRFAYLDSRFYSPLCLLLSINTFLLIFFLK